MATLIEATRSAADAFSVQVETATLERLRDHRVQGMALLPGAACLALALRSARERCAPGAGTAWLRDVEFSAPLALDAAGTLALRVSLWDDDEGGGRRFDVGALAGGEESIHASGRVTWGGAPAHQFPTGIEDAPDCEGPTLYTALARGGNDYGAAFRGVERLWLVPDGALAELRVASCADAPFDADVTAVDAGLHALAAPSALGAAPGRTFVLASVGAAWLAPGACPAWSQALLSPSASGDAPRGDVRLYAGSGACVGELRDVRLAWLERDEARRPVLGLAATFTAEPLEPVLEFWTRELGLPLALRAAPYNQVFQQLVDPGGVLRRNRGGAGLLLLRLEDWAPGAGRAHEGRPTAAGLATRRLPNGLEVAHLNAYETDYLYQEIFVDRVYLRHGVEIGDGDCVFDVGANVGLFSLFARRSARDVRVFAFEPSPGLAPIVAENARRAGGVQVLHCGVSEAAGSADFTFYARSSVFSGYRAERGDDEAALRAVIDNVLARGGLGDAAERAQAVEHLLAGRLEAQVCRTPLVALSDVIDQHGVERVDLLKIDAEKSERAVLRGLREEHWPRVRQIVMEVHDRSGAEPRLLADELRARGFEVTLQSEDLLGGSGLSTLYARRPEARRASALAAAPSLPSPEALAGDERGARLDAAAADFVRTLESVAPELQAPLVLALCPPSPAAATGALGERLRRWHEAIAAAARALPGVDLVVPEDVDALYPVDEVHDARALELGQVPYTEAWFVALGTLLARRLAALRGVGVKVLAVDADETLWRGVCGEAGVEIDADRAAFQEFLAQQAAAGTLICVVSKNRAEDVLAVFREHPGMRLREPDVSAWRVNWRPKSENLASLAAELGLGLESFALLDDNPLECAEVAAHAPQVLALRAPTDASLARFARHVWAFDRATATREDARRGRFYVDEARRREARRAAAGFDEFLSGLRLECRVEPLADEDLARVAQLSERTNQFNLARRPRSVAEVQELARRPGWEWFTARVSDRFGDYGLVGVLAGHEHDGALRVDTFLLSCRALGRGVEQRLLTELGRCARRRRLARVELPFVPAPRNQPARDFLEALEGCRREGDLYVLSPEAAESQRPRPVEAPAEFQAEPAPAGAAERDRRFDAEWAQRAAAELRTPAQVLNALRARGGRAGRGGAGPSDAHDDTPLRALLREVWGDVLGTRAFSAHDDFLALGGTSLQLVQAASRVGRRLGRRLPPDEAFRLRTLDALAAWLETQGLGAPSEPAASITPAADPVAPPAPRAMLDAPASHVQEALVYLHHLKPLSAAYNVPFGARVEGELDPQALRRAFEGVLERHVTLRRAYALRAGGVRAQAAETALDFESLDAGSADAGELEARVRAEARRPFDLRRGPLARLRQWRLGRGRSLLLFTTHHVAVDLWSLELLIEELLLGAQGHEPPAWAEATFDDFVAWQRARLAGPAGEALLDWWRAALAGAPSVLDLRGTGGRTPRGSGASCPVRLEARLVARLRELAQSEGVTLFASLLAAYGALLQAHGAQDDLVVGSPFAARSEERFAAVVGDCVNLLPLRLDLSGRPDFRGLARRASSVVLDGLAHQDMPFPLLTQRLKLRAEGGRAPLVRTTFAVHVPQRLPGLGAFFLPGEREGELRLGGLRLAPLGLAHQEGQFDLALELMPHGDELRGALKYDVGVVDAPLAERLAADFASLLAALVERPDAPVRALAEAQARS